MTRSLLAIAAVAFVSVAAPASALSFTVSFPTLTYPPVSTPDVNQGCADLTTLSGETCTTTSE